MTVPKVTWSVLNGKLGVQKPGGAELHAYVGPCSAGTIATPTRHARSADVFSLYGSGPTCELAARAIEVFGCEVVMCRTTTTTASSFGSIDVTGVTGTSVVTKDAAATSDDDYEAMLKVIAGGTIGVAGITLQTSLDAGRTWSQTVALGTAVVYTIPNSGGVKFAFAAGTLVAGDLVAILCKAPKWNASDLSTALAALKTTLHPWEAVWIAGKMSATEAATVQTFLAALETSTGRCRKAYVELRMPDPGESEATYLASVATDYVSFVEKKVTAAYAAARVVSSRTGRAFNFRRTPLFAISGLPQILPLGVDLSQIVDAGSLPGVSLYDSAGNNVEHDEMLNPGGDDARFLTLRTWPDESGVFVNNPRTLEGAGLDFFLDQHVRILCVFCNEARAALTLELSRALDVNLKDSGPNKAGAPTEAECQRIDKKVRERILAKLRGQVSSIEFAMHRDDPILTTQTMNADGGIVFKGYPKLIQFTVAAINPAALAA